VVNVAANGATLPISTRGADDARTYVKKPLATYTIENVRTPDVEDGDDIYIFEEFT
jgi:hypothetical protein